MQTRERSLALHYLAGGAVGTYAQEDYRSRSCVPLQADFTLMGWLLRICPLDRLNIALCKQTEALSNRCASLAATDCIELAVLLQACNRLH